MALTATELVAGVNAAGFTAEEWNTAKAVEQLQVRLLLKDAELANLDSWRLARLAEYNAQLDTLQQERAAIVAQINALAPSP